MERIVDQCVPKGDHPRKVRDQVKWGLVSETTKTTDALCKQIWRSFFAKFNWLELFRIVSFCGTFIKPRAEKKSHSRSKGTAIGTSLQNVPSSQNKQVTELISAR